MEPKLDMQEIELYNFTEFSFPNLEQNDKFNHYLNIWMWESQLYTKKKLSKKLGQFYPKNKSCKLSPGDGAEK